MKATLRACKSCFRGWWVVLGCFLLQLASAPGHTFGINAFIEHWISDLGVTREQCSVVWLIASLSSAAAVPLAGIMLDKFGARCTIALAAPSLVITLLVVSRAQNILHLSVCIALIRFFGPECLCLVAITTTSRWFVRQRGKAMGALGLSMLIMQLLPPVLTVLIDASGWRLTDVVIACTIAGLTISGFLLVRHAPSTVGLQPDGAPSLTASNEADDKALVESTLAEEADKVLAADDADPVNSGPPLPASSLREACAHPVFWVLAAHDTVFGMFWAGMNLHFVSFVTSLGGELATLTQLECASAFFIPAALSLNTARFLMQFCLLDRLSPRQTLIASVAANVILALLTLAALALRTALLLTIWACCYGALVGMRNCLHQILNPTLFGTVALGAINGASTGIGVGASGIGPLLYAVAKEQLGSYSLCVQVGAVLQLLLAMILAFDTFRIMPVRLRKCSSSEEASLKTAVEMAIGE